MEVNVLLEENRTKTRVESAQTLRPVDLRETAYETAGECRLGDQSDTSSFERAERDVSEELGAGGRSEVDCCAVVCCILVAEERDRLLLEEFVTAEFEGALEEVAGEGWADTCEECACSFLCDDLSKAADHAAVVGCWVELYAGFDAVMVLASDSLEVELRVQAYTSTGVRPP